MATIVNARDVLLQAAGTRLVPAAIIGTLDFANVTGVTKPANNADVTQGAITSGVTVTGGGITLSGGGSIKGGQSGFNSGNGFFLGYSGGAYKLSVGNSSGQNITWDGSTLGIVGNITGAANIDITGTARFRGVQGTSYGSGQAAVVVNDSSNSIDGTLSLVAGNGYAVMGIATGSGVSSGCGVYGRTVAQQGVFGEATSSSGIGVLGLGAGGGYGVYSNGAFGCSSSGAFSGSLSSASLSTGAISGAITTLSTGSWAVNTLTVTNSGSGGGAIYCNNSGSGKQFYAAPGAYSAYSPSGGGKIYIVDGNGPFTGFHPGLVLRGYYTPGDVLVDVAVIDKPDVNNALTTMELCSAVNQAGAVGVLSEVRELDEHVPYELWWEYQPTHLFAEVNGVGEGLINVCGRGGDIAKGDLLVCSDMPGKAQRQADNLVRNYTVAKARESATFDSPDEVKQIACFYMSA